MNTAEEWESALRAALDPTDKARQQQRSADGSGGAEPEAQGSSVHGHSPDKQHGTQPNLPESIGRVRLEPARGSERKVRVLPLLEVGDGWFQAVLDGRPVLYLAFPGGMCRRVNSVVMHRYRLEVGEEVQGG